MNVNELAKYLEFDTDHPIHLEAATLLRTIPALEANLELMGKVNQGLMKHRHSLEAEAEKHNRQLEAAKKLEYQKGYEAGSALTTYNKPRVEALEAEIERFKAVIGDLPQDCIDGGWTAAGASAYAKQLETTLRQQQAEIEALKTKTLTDEEIVAIALEKGLIVEEQLTEDYAHDYVAETVDFARAILRKAQEK